MKHLNEILTVRSELSRTFWFKHAAFVWGVSLGMLALVGCRKASPNLGSKEAPNPLVAKKVTGISGAQVGRNAGLLMQGASVDPAVINKAMGGFVYEAKASYA